MAVDRKIEQDRARIAAFECGRRGVPRSRGCVWQLLALVIFLRDPKQRNRKRNDENQDEVGPWHRR